MLAITGLQHAEGGERKNSGSVLQSQPPATHYHTVAFLDRDLHFNNKHSTMPIQVIEYDPAWPEYFASLAAELSTVLSGLPVRLEHVGSTSVPGLWAKPVLDVDIVTAPAHVPAVIAALSAAGYTHRGNLGIPGREAIASPSDVWHAAKHGGLKRNIYVCAEGCLALRNHLAVRDVLRERADLRDEYAATKRRLAQQTDDINVYVEGKSEVLGQILEAGGISTAERDHVREVNRALEPADA